MSKPTLEQLDEIVSRCSAQLQHTGRSVPFYRHKKSGVLYIPGQVVLRERDLEPLVVYRQKDNLLTPVYFARPFKEFMAKFEVVEDDDPIRPKRALQRK